MEQQRLLNPDNDVDMFCLHYLAEPLLKAALERFVLSWNHHALRTEGEKSPTQLFTAGLEALRQHAEESGELFTELEQVTKFVTDAQPSKSLTMIVRLIMIRISKKNPRMAIVSILGNPFRYLEWQTHFPSSKARYCASFFLQAASL